ncbi:hypothetical protein L484_004080 [Morus notabilis]|uniref:Uncharacterized protein n=1 Tax=Morus notabilis TaxID=981085 RepID=W9QHZ1_9ROSA|nr:hypothetical protein L484_004080 [Morus notabilis]
MWGLQKSSNIIRYIISPLVVQRVGSRRDSSLLGGEVSGALAAADGRPRTKNLMAWARVAWNRPRSNGVDDNIAWGEKEKSEKKKKTEVKAIHVLKNRSARSSPSIVDPTANSDIKVHTGFEDLTVAVPHHVRGISVMKKSKVYSPT